jgi:2-polyprenyl-3-methyl-5-hydroxy-6-metoxy-1,4-benzoquinol methylase
LSSFYEDSVRDCRQSVLDNLPPADVLLDFGCADGALTSRFASRAGARAVLGVEVLEELADQARERGIEVVEPENGHLPIEDETVDAVTANQVIEHLADTDGFVQEIHRVLRPGGTFVVSTNNLASWHNIVALVAGAQPFPSDVSSNPTVGKLMKPAHLDDTLQGEWASWTHLRVFSYRALIEMMQQHRFTVQRAQGVGYYPLPSRLARRVAAWDPRHAAYLTVSCVKN